MNKIKRTPTFAGGGITPEEKARMDAHVQLWEKRIMRTAPIEPEKIALAIQSLYFAADLPKPRIVIVPSPIVMAIAGGLSAAIWWLRKNGDTAAYTATRDATHAAALDATYAATLAATLAATYAATRATTDDATRDATYAATDAATDAATYAATHAAALDATRAATDAATDDATYAATRAAALDATYAATLAATYAATRATTDDATYAATDAATRAATLAATYDATDAATRAAALDAAYDATRDATHAATLAATLAAMYDATDAATDAATYDATDAATHAATHAATRDATRAATRDATHAAIDAATRAATLDATYATTDAATRDVTYGGWIKYLLNNFLPRRHHEFAIYCMRNWLMMYQGGNMWGQYDCYLAAARDILGLELPCHAKYAAWEQAAIHGGFRLMHPEFCMVCDFPKTLKKNERNQPHCPDGPSHEWRDGFKIYHLNGIRCEEWHVMTPPEKLDPRLVLGEPNVDIRRELIRRVGVEMMLAALPHRVMDKRGDYEVLSVDFPDLLNDARYLKMLNPSIGVWHMEGIERECNTVQQALNWRAKQVLPSGQNWAPSQLT